MKSWLAETRICGQKRLVEVFLAQKASSASRAVTIGGPNLPSVGLYLLFTFPNGSIEIEVAC